MEKLKDRIEKLKEKRPGYGGILDFYLRVREEQEQTKGSLKIEPIFLKKSWKDLLTQEGFPLLQRQDFPLDIEASIGLFRSLCKIAEGANDYMAGQVRIVEETLKEESVDLKRLLKESLEEKRIEQFAGELNVDRIFLTFLVQSSTKPSIELVMRQLQNEIDSQAWLKGYCPICTSLPYLSLLKEETGKRFLLCSFCEYQWRIERLTCPFCGNKDQGSLHYFRVEGEGAHRIDLCDRCHQYIKTIDLREIEISEPSLENLATLHLDVLASQKGYRRPAPNLWMG